MKRRLKKTIAWLLRISLILVFLLVIFFGTGAVFEVKAACQYSVNFDVQPRIVRFDGKVTFTTNISLSQCSESPPPKISIQYYVTRDSTVSEETFFGKNYISDRINLDVSNDQAQNTHDYYMNNFYSADGKDFTGNPGGFPQPAGHFFVRVYDGPFGYSTNNVTTSNAEGITITGPGSSATANPGAAGAGGGELAPYASYEACKAAGQSEAVCSQYPKTAGSAAKPGAGAGTGVTLDASYCKTHPNDCLYNPLPEEALTDMLIRIMKGFLAIVGIWAVAFIIFGGFKMVMAAGNEEAYTAAKKTVVWAVLGLLIALLSFSIIAIVQNLFGVEIKPPPS